MEKLEPNWMPLEGNPEVFNSYSLAIGFPTNELCFHDVFSLDADIWGSYLP